VFICLKGGRDWNNPARFEPWQMFRDRLRLDVGGLFWAPSYQWAIARENLGGVFRGLLSFGKWRIRSSLFVVVRDNAIGLWNSVFAAISLVG
jgi:hypothetical protein